MRREAGSESAGQTYPRRGRTVFEGSLASRCDHRSTGRMFGLTSRAVGTITFAASRQWQSVTGRRKRASGRGARKEQTGAARVGGTSAGETVCTRWCACEHREYCGGLLWSVALW
jgi:hypothetical protein